MLAGSLRLSLPTLERGYCKGKTEKVKGKSEEEKRIFHSHFCLNLPRRAGTFWGVRPHGSGCE